MQEEERKKRGPGPDAQWEKTFWTQLRRTDDCPSARLLLSEYENIRTKTIPLTELLAEREKEGVVLAPDQLIRDDLQCVYESAATDVFNYPALTLIVSLPREEPDETGMTTETVLALQDSKCVIALLSSLSGLQREEHPDFGEDD